MINYYVRRCKGKDLGTWKGFIDELAQIYGQRDDKEGAKKEITAFFTNKDLVFKDFVKYVERFRTLGQFFWRSIQKLQPNSVEPGVIA